ncbi:hypothetical protein GCK32_006289 [Trichostrongylus colubriformis]|uniref:Uncharacterized protein n=1 Tax=Trichostrongylus colubriformis TaxID=6319 RepID=A0AAN8FQE3_TRICO
MEPVETGEPMCDPPAAGDEMNNAPKVTQLLQRKHQVVTYIERLQAEKEEWEQLLERQRMKNEHAANKIDRPYERKHSARVPVEDLGQIDVMEKPRHVLNRVLRALNKKNEQHQKSVDELEAKCKSISSSTNELKTRIEALVALLNAEPKEELLARKKWLEDIRNKEDRRIQLLEEKLVRLEAQETFYNNACIC